MIGKGATDSEVAVCIQKSWLELFHIPVSGTAVKALVMHYRAVHGSSSKRVTRKSKRKGKGQHGGMAPLDYMMGQGLTSQSFGRFPVEMGTTPNVLNGLDLGGSMRAPRGARAILRADILLSTSGVVETNGEAKNSSVEVPLSGKCSQSRPT